MQREAFAGRDRLWYGRRVDMAPPVRRLAPAVEWQIGVNLIAALDYLPNGDADVVVVLACVRLGGLAPAPVEEDGDGLYACAGRRIGLTHDAASTSRLSPPLLQDLPRRRWS